MSIWKELKWMKIKDTQRHNHSERVERRWGKNLRNEGKNSCAQTEKSRHTITFYWKSIAQHRKKCFYSELELCLNWHKTFFFFSFSFIGNSQVFSCACIMVQSMDSIQWRIFLFVNVYVFVSLCCYYFIFYVEWELLWKQKKILSRYDYSVAE